MIVGGRKPLKEIVSMLEPYNKILVLGCGECVTVCMAGGEKEVEETAQAIALDRKRKGQQVHVDTAVVRRQCEYEFIESCREQIEKADIVLSLACGVGVQTMTMYLPETQTVPGLNTQFMGMPTERGVWLENCLGCGDCLLETTMGICPITRCSKSMLNGPCGGSQHGKCEVNSEIECGWHLIYDRLVKFDRLAHLEKVRPAKDWSRSHSGGPRKMVRGDMKLESNQ